MSDDFKPFDESVYDATEWWDDVPSGPDVPAGIYDAQIVSTAPRLASTGRQQLQINVCLQGGAHDGKTLVDFVCLKPLPEDKAFTKQRAKTVRQQITAAIGRPPEEAKRINPASWAGERLRVRVAVGKDQDGQPRSKIQSYLSLGSGAPSKPVAFAVPPAPGTSAPATPFAVPAAPPGAPPGVPFGRPAPVAAPPAAPADPFSPEEDPFAV